MELKQYRTALNITATEASQVTSVPFRTYIRYENDDSYGSKLKREAIFNILKEKYEITEEKGILTLDYIKTKCKEVFDKYEGQIEFCYLFGSYAKGYAQEKSDVDLMISTKITGLKFFGLLGELNTSLHKHIDLLRMADLKGNMDLLSEVMKDGIKIYG